MCRVSDTKIVSQATPFVKSVACETNTKSAVQVVTFGAGQRKLVPEINLIQQFIQ